MQRPVPIRPPLVANYTIQSPTIPGSPNASRQHGIYRCSPCQCTRCTASSAFTTPLGSTTGISSSKKKKYQRPPSKCLICNKMFAMKSTRNRHVRVVHARIRPNKCEVCGKSFASPTCLKVHMRIHTGLRPYECEVCHRLFTVRSSRARHMRKVHNMQPPSAPSSTSMNDDE